VLNHHPTRAQATRGSVLMLMPAAVLIVLLLGSLAVDFAIAFLAEREVVDAASAAANDAATFGLDENQLRQSGALVLDRGRAEEAVRQSIVSRGSALLDRADVSVDVTAASVRVRISSRAQYLFARVIPGAPDGIAVSAIAAAGPQRR
jgi:hypothetical protein